MVNICNDNSIYNPYSLSNNCKRMLIQLRFHVFLTTYNKSLQLQFFGHTLVQYSMARLRDMIHWSVISEANSGTIYDKRLCTIRYKPS